MRAHNWSGYNKNLVARGSITFLVDPKVFKKHPFKSTGGKPKEFSDQLIIMLMMVKVHFKASYRFLEGFTKSIIKHPVPSYSLVCKRAACLKAQLPTLPPCRSGIFLIDATGAKVMGEGEWKVKVHGATKRRRWVKIHVALDAQTQEVVAEVTTQGSVADSSQISELLSQIPNKLHQVAADSAYDGVSQHITQRGACPLIPPPKNGRLGKKLERNDAIRIRWWSISSIFMGQAN